MEINSNQNKEGYDYTAPNSINDNENLIINDLEDGLNDDPQNEPGLSRFYLKKYSLIKCFIIIIIQYIIIALFTFIGIFFEINDKMIKYINPIIIPIIISSIMFILSIISNEFLQNYKNKKGLIAYHIIYSILLACFCIYLSIYIESKYIYIGLGIILLEPIFLLICTFIFIKYEKLYFSIIASTPNILGIIVVSAFYIKSLYPIIFISIFGILTIAYFIAWIWISLSKKFYHIYEYLYSVIIFNYGIFLGIAFIIAFIAKKFIKPGARKVYEFFKNFFNYYINKIKSNDSDENYFLKIYLIFLAQHTFITIFMCIGLSFNLEKTLEEYILTYLTGNILIHLIAVLSIYPCRNIIETKNKIPLIIFSVIHIPIMIIYYLILSLVVGPQYVLSFIFILFIDTFTVLLSNYFFKSEKFCKEYFVSSIVNLIALVLFYFLWFENIAAFSPIIGLNFVFFAFFALFPYFMMYKFKDYKNIPILIFNNSFMIITIMIAVICAGIICFLIYLFLINCK